MSIDMKSINRYKSFHCHVFLFFLYIVPHLLRVSAFPDLESLHIASVLNKRDLEEDISILEETFFEADDDELTRLEISSDHQANVLSVRKIKC